MRSTINETKQATAKKNTRIITGQKTNSRVCNTVLTAVVYRAPSLDKMGNKYILDQVS